LTTDLAVHPLRAKLEELRSAVIDEGEEIYARWEPRIERSAFVPSARNLARYIALRRRDLRGLQRELMSLGLSSLGRCEARVLENIDSVLCTVAELDHAGGQGPSRPSAKQFFDGYDRLRRQTQAALGPARRKREVRIMVTLPSDAASDDWLARALIERGMDVARINCAHDDPEAWRAMSDNVRRAADELRRPCRICMDICGPRARTARVSEPDGRRLQIGDQLWLRRAGVRPEAVAARVQFECSLSEVAPQLRPGDPVWVDGGKLGAAVERVDERGALLRVTHARKKGSRLRPGKGLNFPDTPLDLDPLTPKDLRDLNVVAEIADLVGYSFVQRPGDIELLQRELAARGAPKIAIAAKVETKLATGNLPELIIQAAGRQPLAVMIARGDLAIELGYRRMAEIQEEILWLCEAAHVPVIWATEVLDGFVRDGLGARAEITDAAMAERAECVMLNKGPFVLDAVSLLDDVLSRMQAHQFKKTSQMRALRLW
jgi:pyruvate kinase